MLVRGSLVWYGKAMRVQNVSSAPVTLPHNRPEDLLAAALKAGVDFLYGSNKAYFVGHETLMADAWKKPEQFVLSGYPDRAVSIDAGASIEIDEAALFDRARGELVEMTKPGGSLRVVG